MSTNGMNDLLIVGPGVLGKRVAALWHEEHPDASIVGETRTTSSHAGLRAAGIIPTVFPTDPEMLFSQVVFCAPPTGNVDYPGCVRAAAARTEPAGTFVFTSSGSVYAEPSRGSSGVTTENSPTSDSQRAKNLLDAEDVALEISGGRVVRLGGLYTGENKIVGYWLNEGHVKGSADGLINLIHYDDAATIVMATLKAGGGREGVGERGMRVFLGAAGPALSRKEICSAALNHPLFRTFDMPTFDEDAGGSIKTYDNSASCVALDWKPRWASFQEFMQAEANASKVGQC
jgi:nucleoside-diphosphate-sugar epimerase